MIPKTILHDVIKTGKYDIYGSSDQMDPVEDQFKHYVYPLPGKTEIHMLWTDTPCFSTCWNDANAFHHAMQMDKIEFILIQHPWLENDCHLCRYHPARPIPNLRKMISALTTGRSNTTAFTWKRKASNPAASPRAIMKSSSAIAEKMGLKEKYTEGKTIQQWIKTGFDGSGVEKAGLCTWEQMKEKKYYVVPTDPNWEKIPAGMIEFYEDPEKYPHVYSQRQAGVLFRATGQAFPG